MQQEIQVHTYEQLGDRHYLITERYTENGPGVNIGLVVGEHRAAVIDSGFGVTDTLRLFIEEITDRPLVCIVAHGHPDHVGAAPLFDEVYMNARDADLLPVSFSYARRMEDVFRHIENPALYAYCQTHIVDGGDFTYSNIDEGDTVDLGGVRLEAQSRGIHRVQSRC